jgi:hypothetical protein
MKILPVTWTFFLMDRLMIRLTPALERPGFPLEHFIKLFL